MTRWTLYEQKLTKKQKKAEDKGEVPIRWGVVINGGNDARVNQERSNRKIRLPMRNACGIWWERGHSEHGGLKVTLCDWFCPPWSFSVNVLPERRWFYDLDPAVLFRHADEPFFRRTLRIISRSGERCVWGWMRRTFSALFREPKKKEEKASGKSWFQ